jgi:predicted tellurium resistance membrane protein TerC
MEAESIESLTPLIQSADRWSEVVVLLPLLVALEAVLSADNAIALAAISRRLHDRARQEMALNLGLLLALVFRIVLILAARWVLNFWPLELAAAAYLLWLCGRHLRLVAQGREEGIAGEPPAAASPGFTGSISPVAASSAATATVTATATATATATVTATSTNSATSATAKATTAKANTAKATTAKANDRGAQPMPVAAGLAGVVATLALTDLAFSLDSVAAAVAVSDRISLVIAGGVIGLIALRLTAELFIRWLERYRHLETAGYLAVGLVGLRLLLRLGLPDVVPPEWLLLLMVAVLFVWGFSERNPEPPSLVEAD